MSGKINPITFLKEVRAEGMKVVWPDRREAAMSMVFVCFVVALFSVLLFFIDKITQYGVWLVVSLLEKIFG